MTYIEKRTPTQLIWKAMRARCLNPNSDHYNYYGGRGIKICDRWLSYGNFLNDMGERPDGMTLDRIDTDGDYTPENCKWASRADQVRNRRMSKLTVEDARWIRLHQGLYPQTYMAKKFGVNPSVISNIIHNRLWKDV